MPKFNPGDKLAHKEFKVTCIVVRYEKEKWQYCLKAGNYLYLLSENCVEENYALLIPANMENE